MTALFTFLVNGVTFKTHLFLKSRELIFCSSWSDWLTWSVSLVLIVLVLYFLGYCGTGWASWSWPCSWPARTTCLIERKVLAQRQPAMDKLDGLLRTMRLGGLEEDAIRMFVCKYAGDRWEPLYEAAFGYDYLLQARQHWAKAGTGNRRPQHASWRDPIILWIDAAPEGGQGGAREKHLLKVEQKQLEAQGLKGAEARPRPPRWRRRWWFRRPRSSSRPRRSRTMPARQPPRRHRGRARASATCCKTSARPLPPAPRRRVGSRFDQDYTQLALWPPHPLFAGRGAIGPGTWPGCGWPAIARWPTRSWTCSPAFAGRTNGPTTSRSRSSSFRPRRLGRCSSTASTQPWPDC